MTPFKRDCDDIYSISRKIYLADGSSVICKQSSSIDIPIIENNKNLNTLKLDDVLIVHHLLIEDCFLSILFCAREIIRCMLRKTT